MSRDFFSSGHRQRRRILIATVIGAFLLVGLPGDVLAITSDAPVLFTDPTARYFTPESADLNEKTAPLDAGFDRQVSWYAEIRPHGSATLAVRIPATGTGTSSQGFSGDYVPNGSWNGKDSTGTRLPDGVYDVQLHAKATPSGVNETVVPFNLGLSATLPTGTLTAPAAGSTLTGNVPVSVSVTTPYSLIQVRVENAAGTGIFTSATNPTPPTISGTGDSTKIPNGAQTLHAQLWTSDDLGYDHFVDTPGVAVTVDNTLNVSATGGHWVIPGSADDGSTTVTYSLNKSASVTTTLQSGSTVLRTLETAHTATTGSATWDGKIGGTAATPGPYTIVVTGNDGSGPKTASRTVGVLKMPTGTVNPLPNDELVLGQSTLEFVPSSEALAYLDPYYVYFETTDGDSLCGTTEPVNGTWSCTAFAPGISGTVSIVAYMAAYDPSYGPPNYEGDHFQLPATAPITATVNSNVGVFMDSWETYLSPNGDGDEDTVTLQYSLSGAAPVTSVLKDSGGTVVRTFASAESQAIGSHSVIFDGTDGSSTTPLPTGTYTFDVTAGSGSGAGHASREVHLDSTVLDAPVVAPVSDGDTIPNDYGQFRVNWTRPAGSTATYVSLYGEGNTSSLTNLYDDGTGTGTFTGVVSALQLGSGPHTLTVQQSGTDMWGDYRTWKSDGADVSFALPMNVTSLFPDTGPFDPEDPELGAFSVYTGTDQPASIAWRVSKNGTVVRDGTLAPCAPAYCFSGIRIDWDGLDNDGQAVVDGDYVFSFTATAPKDANSHADGGPLTITVDRTRPGALTAPTAGATIGDAAPLAFTPDSTVIATPDDLSFVTVRAKNGTGDTGAWSLTKTAGDPVWHGTADTSALPDGSYTLSVSAYWRHDSTEGFHVTGVRGPTVTLKHGRLLTSPPTSKDGFLIVPDAGTDSGNSDEYADSLPLARLSTVTVTVLNDGGVVATPRSASSAPAGPLSIGWDGKIGGAAAPTGQYTLHIAADDGNGSTDSRDVPIDVLAGTPAQLTGVPIGDTSGTVAFSAGTDAQITPLSGTLYLYRGTDTYTSAFAPGSLGTSGINFSLPTPDYDNGVYRVAAYVSWKDRFGGYHSTTTGELPLSIDNGISFTGLPAGRTLTTNDPNYLGMFTLSENAPVVVTIRNSADQLIRTLPTVTGHRGLYTSYVSWDGTDGVTTDLVPDDIYTLHMVATDAYKGTTAAEDVQVTVARFLPGSIVTPAAGAPVSGSSYAVTWTQGTDPHVTSINSVQVSAPHLTAQPLSSDGSGNWTGSIDTRNLVDSADRLTFTVQWTDDHDSDHVYASFVNVVPSNNPVTITSVTDPHAFTPTGNGSPEHMSLQFTPSSCVPVIVVVKDGSDAVVRHLNGETGTVVCRNGGTLAWDGRDDNGSYAPDGDYTLVATATPVGAAPASVSVDTTLETDPIVTLGAIADPVSDSLPLTATENAAFTAGDVEDVGYGIPGSTTMSAMTAAATPGTWTGTLDLPATLTGALGLSVRPGWTDSYGVHHTAVLDKTINTDETTLTMKVLTLGLRGEAPFTTEAQIDATAVAGPITWTLDPRGDDQPVQTGSGASPLRANPVFAYSTPGTYSPLLEVTDPAGHRRHWMLSVTVDPPANKVPSLVLGTPNRTKGVAGPDHPLAITIPVTATDTDGTVDHLVVDWGDGPAEIVAGSPDSVGHTYVTGGGFGVHVTAVDDEGGSTGKDATLVVDDDVPLTATTAAAGAKMVTIDGKDVVFDAGTSAPAAVIDDYTWTFDDGTVLHGARVTHAWADPDPNHTVVLTTHRNDGIEPIETSTTQTVQVLPKEDTTVSTVTVVPGAGAMVAYTDGDGTTQAVPTENGKAVIYGLPVGTSKVAGFAPGYQATDGEVTVEGGVGTGTITLNSGPLAEAKVGVTRATPEQLEAAGIDPNAAENRTIFKLKISIPYTIQGGSPGTFNLDALQEGPDLFDPHWDDPEHLANNPCTVKASDGTIHQITCRMGGAGGPIVQATPTEQGGQPQLVLLALSADASMMKEFFNVDLTVRNLSESPLAKITGGVGTLKMGSGLALAPSAVPQSIRQDMDDIPAKGESKASWIIRGDDPGDTSVAAAFHGTLSPFGANVDITAADAPVHVYGAGAVQVIVQASPQVKKDQPFVIRMGLKNVTKDAFVYNAQLGLEPDVDWVTPLPHEAVSRIDKIAPGDTWFAEDWQFLWTKDDGSLDLSKLPAGAITRVAAAGQLPPPPPANGSTDIIEAIGKADDPVQNPVSLFQNAGDDGLLHLHWDGVTGASSYQLLQSQPGSTGYVPVGEPVSGTSADIPLADTPPSSTQPALMRSSFGRSAPLMRTAAVTATSTRDLVLATTINGKSLIRHNMVHATPPYADATVSDGNWTLKGKVNKTATGYLVDGSATLNGLILTPTGSAKLELNTQNHSLTLDGAGTVVLGLPIGGKTVDLATLNTMTWPLTAAIPVAVEKAVLLGLAVKDGVDLGLEALEPGKLQLTATVLPPPLVAAAPAIAKLDLDTTGAVSVDGAKIEWPDATFATLGRGSVALALSTAGGAAWDVTGTLASGTKNGTLDGHLGFDVDGNLTEGSFSAKDIALFGLAGVDELALTASSGGASWAASGTSGGNAVTGSLTVDTTTRTVTAGSLGVAKVPVAGLATFENFTASYAGDTWTLDTTKPVVHGTLTVSKGALTGGSLTATDLPVGGLVTAKSLALAYDAATSAYSADGVFDLPGRPGAFTGKVKVLDGALTDTTLSSDKLDLGPLQVSTAKLAWSGTDSKWSVSGTSTTLGSLISVSSFRAAHAGTPGASNTWELSGATGAGSVGGSLTTDETGAVTDGSITSSRLQVGLLDLPAFSISKSGSVWSGSVGTGDSAADFSFTYDGTALSAGRVHAAKMHVVGLGDVTDFALSFASNVWTVSSTKPVFTGTLTVADGVVTGGTLHTENVPVLGLFTAKVVDLAYTPADASYTGSVTLDLPDQASVATVSVTVKNGAIQQVDIGLPDLPLLGLVSANGVHLLWKATGEIALTATHGEIRGLVTIDTFKVSRSTDGGPFHVSGDYTAPGTSGHVDADLTVTDGQLSAGSVTFAGLALGGVLPLGDVTLGYADGAWKLGATGAPLVFDVQKGVLQAGHIGLPKIDVAGVFSMAGVHLDYSGNTWSGTIDGPSVDFGFNTVSLTYDDKGFAAGQLKGAVPLLAGWGLQSINASYTRDTNSWAGAATLKLPNGTIGGSLAIENGTFKEASIQGSTSLPIAPNVSLTGVNAKLTMNPFHLEGSATFGLGPVYDGTHHIATSTGAFAVTSSGDTTSWDASATIGLGGLPLSAGARLGYEHPAGTATIAGTFNAGVPAAHVSATLGAKFTPASETFTLSATGEIVFLGQTASGTVAVTEKGYGGCGQLDALGTKTKGGFFKPWTGPQQNFGSCDLAPFQTISGVAGASLRRAVNGRQAAMVRTAALVAAPSGSGAFSLPGGQDTVLLKFVGVTAAPVVDVRNPSGAITGTALTDADQKTTYVALVSPVSGTWTYEVVDGQVLASAPESSASLPAAVVTAAAPVPAADGPKSVAVHVVPLPAQEVQVVEVAPDGMTQAIGTLLADGTLGFTPLAGDGTHALNALVLQGGTLRTTIPLTTFTVGAPTGGTGGDTTGATTGSTTGATTGSTTGSTTGATTGATTGSTTGATTGSTTGSTTGDTTGATTGSTTGATTGTPSTTTGGTTGSTTGGTGGSTTGGTGGSTTGATTGTPSTPPSGSPTSSPTGSQCRSSIDTPRTGGVVGRPVTVTVRGVPGRAVELRGYVRPATSYRLLRTGTIPATGVLVFTLAPTGNMRVFAVQPGCVASATVPFVMHSVVSLTGVRAGGHTFVYTGRVRPGYAGQTVRIYRKLTHGDPAPAVGRTDRYGRFTIRWTMPPETGPVWVFARAVGSTATADGTSPALKVVP